MWTLESLHGTLQDEKLSKILGFIYIYFHIIYQILYVVRTLQVPGREGALGLIRIILTTL